MDKSRSARRPPARPKPHRRRSEAAPAAERPPDSFRIAGMAAVAAVFARDPGRVERLFYEPRLKDAAGPFCAVLAKARRPYRMVEAEELGRIAGTVLHGGIVAVTRPPELPAFDLEQAKLWAAAAEPMVVLDGVGNPHNLGAIVRTMAFFGLRHLVLSDHSGQAEPSEAAYRVAEGGFEWVAVSRARRLPIMLKRLTAHYHVVGTALGGAKPFVALAAGGRPPALVLGNEEQGLPPATLQACEAVVTIPGSGHIQSLNVAAAAAILLHAVATAR